MSLTWYSEVHVLVHLQGAGGVCELAEGEAVLEHLAAGVHLEDLHGEARDALPPARDHADVGLGQQAGLAGSGRRQHACVVEWETLNEGYVLQNDFEYNCEINEFPNS